MTSTQEAALLRQLNAEFGVEPFAGLKGVLMGTAIVAAIFAVAAVFLMPIEQGARIYGRVESISLKETDYGTRLVARVQTGDRYGLVPLPRGAMCAPGDRIELMRRRTLVGMTYRIGLGGCVRM